MDYKELMFSMVFYSTNIDNLNIIRDKIVNRYMFYTSIMYEIHTKTINDETYYYFRYNDQDTDCLNVNKICRKMNSFTKPYDVRWALEIYDTELDCDNEYYMFDETNSFLDNDKVHISFKDEYLCLDCFVENINELKDKVKDYINEDDIDYIINNISFNKRSSINCIIKYKKRDITVSFNSFKKMDDKYFYWS